MTRLLAVSLGFAIVCAIPAEASELRGPGRFCGYSPIIDLLAGEKVITLQSGIHGGRFRWEGAFGPMEVRGIGWASRPKGRILRTQTDSRPARFAQSRREGLYEIAIWNGANGAAYFTSPTPFTARQLKAIDRVRLFEEGQDPPSDCKFKTITVWE